MNLIAEIFLPAGVTKVTIRDIPELFATALYPGMNENTSEEMTDSKLIAWQVTVDEYKKEVKSAISRGEGVNNFV